MEKIEEREKMADLTTNNYISKQPYIQNKIAYGDGNSAIPTNYNDKRLDSVKDNFKTNPLGKVAGGIADSSEKDNKMNMPILLALGTVPTLLIDKATKEIIKGKSFKKSRLGWLTKKIDDFSASATTKFPVLKFDWAKSFSEKIKNIGFIKQAVDAPAAMPVWSQPKSMVVPAKDSVLKELIEEAGALRTQISVTKLTAHLEKGQPGSAEQIYNSVIKLAGENPSKQFVKLLKELEKLTAKNASEQAKNDVLKNLIEEAVTLKTQSSVTKLTTSFQTGQSEIKQIYDSAVRLAGNNPSEKFAVLRNRAEALADIKGAAPKSALSNFLLTAHNSVSKVINLGSFGKGIGGKLGPLFGFLMTAYFLGDSVKKTIDAPKGEKKSTLAHAVIVDFISSWLLFDPIAKFMYKGIGVLNKVNAEGIGKFRTKPLNLVGKVLSTGLDMPEAKTFLGKAFNGVKGFGGGIGRFALMMMVLFPVVDKISRFVSHTIFGKPTTLLAKEKAEAEKDNEPAKTDTDELSKALAANKGMLTVAAKTQTNMQNNTNTGINPMIAERLKLRALTADSKPGSSQLPENNKEQEIAAKNSDNNGQPEYIPSDTRKDPSKNIDAETKLNAALAESDRKIKAAQDTLNSI